MYESIFSGDVKDLGVFNMRMIETLVGRFYKNEMPVSGRFLEIIMWLTSFGRFLQKTKSTHEVQVGSGDAGTRDSLSLRGLCEVYLYNERQKYIIKKRNAASI